MKWLRVVLAAWMGIACAALPTNDRVHAVLTPSGKVDTRYRDGNDGTAGLPLSWAPIPTEAGIQGTPRTVNLRSLYLTDPSAGATLVTTCSPTLGGGWSTTADGLSFTYSGAYTGACSTAATVSGKTATSLTYTISSAASSGADTTAPAQVFGATATATGTGIHLSWYPSAEPHVSGQNETGLKEYRVYRDASGSALATINTSAATAISLTGVELGGSTGGSVVQTGNNYSVVSAGDGVGGTTESGYFAYQQITGDFRLCADLHTITGGNANAHIALMARSSLAGGDPTAFTRINTTSARTRGRGSAGAATTAYGSQITQAPPAVECLVRSGTSWTSTVSAVGNTFTTVDTSMPTALPSTVYAGVFVGTGTSTTTTGDIRNLTLTNQAPLTYDDPITDGASHAYTVKAVDVAGNLSTASAAVSATAPSVADTTPPAAPTGLTGSGPTSTSVSWTWTNPTDPSGIRGCVPSWATTSGGSYTDQPEQVATSFALTGLSASTTRWLKVKCVDGAGNTGAFSSAVSATSATAPGADSTPPTVPTGNSATGQNTADFLIQTSGSTDGGCGVADYRLYASTASGGPFNLVATFTTAPYTYHSAGPASTTYYFKLTARDCASPQNESAQSATFSGSTTVAAGGNLLFSDMFPTLTSGAGPTSPCSSFGFPNCWPQYGTNWKSIGDPTCAKNVLNTVMDGSNNTAAFTQTLTDQTAQHCMIKYDGPDRNFVAGAAYWLGFEMELKGAWVENDSGSPRAGAFAIVWQLHPDNSPGNSTNPMVNFEAGPGPGHPWVFNVVGTGNAQYPGHRFVNYPLADGTGNCGNIVKDQLIRVVMRIVISANNATSGAGAGSIDVYMGGISTPPTLCIRDRGLNDYLLDNLRPYWTVGTYWGEGGSCVKGGSCPPSQTAGAPHTFYLGEVRFGRESDGIGFNDVVSR